MWSLPRPALALAALVVLGLTGCSGDPTPAASPDTAAPTSEASAAPSSGENRMPEVDGSEFAPAFKDAMAAFYDRAESEGKAVLTTGVNYSGNTQVTAENVFNPDGSLLSTNESSDGVVSIETRCLPDHSCYTTYDKGKTWMRDPEVEKIASYDPRLQAGEAVSTMTFAYGDVEYRMTDRAFEMTAPQAGNEGMFYQFTPASMSFISNMGGERVQSKSTFVDPVPVDKPENIVEPAPASPEPSEGTP